MIIVTSSPWYTPTKTTNGFCEFGCGKMKITIAVCAWQQCQKCKSRRLDVEEKEEEEVL